jgi:hypothetical protein
MRSPDTARRPFREHLGHVRVAVPRDTWLTLLREASGQIDVLVFSGTFFAQSAGW